MSEAEQATKGGWCLAHLCYGCGCPHESRLRAEDLKPPESKVHPDVLRTLRAMLHRLPGGHAPALQRDLAGLSREGGRMLLSAIRHLESERDSERQKRRQGRFF